MFNGFESYVAKRYLVTRKKTGFISLISLISIFGIAVGVAALIIVLSLMNGFSKELRTRLMGMDGHIWVRSMYGRTIPDYKVIADSLMTLPGVVGVSPFCGFDTVATPHNGVYAKAAVRGVDSESIDTVSDIKTYIRPGGSFDLSENENGVPGVVLGAYLAYELDNAQIGDIIILYGVDDTSIDNFLGMDISPKQKHFRITGIFESGYYDYDNMVMLVDISQAQDVLNYPNVATGISVKLENMFNADRYTGSDGLIQQVVGEHMLRSDSWQEQNKTLFTWMKFEKWAAFIVLSLIVLVAAFNIISSLIMLVMDKTQEIGILKSMGATSRSIERIFVYQGALIGVCGTFLGGTIGIGITYLQDRYQIISLPPDIYFVSALPMDMQITDAIAIIIVTFLLCFISSFYPAKKAAGLDPVEAIRSK